MTYQNYRRTSLLLIAVAFVGCGEDGVPRNPVIDKLAESCGIDIECEAGGIAEGNGSISGVPSIDAFFQSVINFQATAGNVSAALDAEVAAIGGDFGVTAGGDFGAKLKAKIDANVEGGLKVVYEPARCAVDASATVEASARCEGKVDPGKLEVDCKGSCQVEASASVMCDASAELRCTVTAPSVMCMGECSGTCEAPMVNAACSGTCTGTCSGTCSAYAKNAMGQAQCAGECSGMCMGSCKAAFKGPSCMGKCEGECTVTKPSGGCEGGIRAECKGEANAEFKCEGKCEGEFEPPMASVECQASAKAEAKLNVECSPPRVAIAYKFKAGVSAMAQAEFIAAVKNLEVRLPRLLAAFAKAELVVDAGEGLITDAKGALKAGIKIGQDAAAEGNLRVTFGLACALEEAGNVPEALGDASGRLSASVMDAADVQEALGM